MNKFKPKNEPLRVFSVENDGFYGMYFEPEINRFPGKGMVICTGSDASFLLCRLGADKFLEEGMPVIALGYFGVEGTSKDPLNIPVEYMQRACLWLKEEKKLHVGVWGISLGGEFALLAGSLFPEIECVVAASPVHILTQCGSFNGGLHFAAGGPFARNGETLPYVGLPEAEANVMLKRMKRNMFKRLEPDMLFFYQEMFQRAHDPETEIPVENINGPVLLISGEQDVMVPAKYVCEQVIERLRAHNFCYPAVHKNYDPLSHYACPLRPATSSMFKVERRQKNACNASREQEWKDTICFLREQWVL